MGAPPEQHVWTYDEVLNWKAPEVPKRANPWAPPPPKVEHAPLPAVARPPKHWPEFLPHDWKLGKRKLPGGSYHVIFVKPSGTHFFWRPKDAQAIIDGTSTREGTPIDGYRVSAAIREASPLLTKCNSRGTSVM